MEYILSVFRQSVLENCTIMLGPFVPFCGGHQQRDARVNSVLKIDLVTNSLQPGESHRLGWDSCGVDTTH